MRPIEEITNAIEKILQWMNVGSEMTTAIYRVDDKYFLCINRGKDAMEEVLFDNYRDAYRWQQRLHTLFC